VQCMQFQGLQAAYDVLTSATDARGRGIKVVKLPLPPPLHVTEVHSHEAALQLRLKCLIISSPYAICAKTGAVQEARHPPTAYMPLTVGASCCSGGERWAGA
jgi:agmatine/peptidylarginine deiminase